MSGHHGGNAAGIGVTTVSPPDIDRLPSAGNAVRPQRRPVNLRSVGTGLLVTCLISALAPYNDLLVANTFLIGGTMPIGLLVFFLLLVLLVNAPLRRLAPRLALSGPELAVALGMGLVGCGVPAVGFHNYVMGSIVGLWHGAGQDLQTAQLLGSLRLPAWLFPLPQTADAAAAAMDPAIANYVGRTPNGAGGVPWQVWLAPALSWGAWLGCFGGAVLCLALIVRRQWVENERLAFPVASVYTTLLQDPEPGRSLNRVLRSRLFWIALSAVFVLRGINSLSVYLPLYVPALPLGFDLRPIMAQPPLSHAHVFFKAQNLYFAVIGITFLLQTRIAFSLWFLYVLFQVVVMAYAGAGAEFTAAMQQDQMAGSLLVLAGMVLWIGRGHWIAVLRQMIGRGRPGDPQDPYVPYRWSGWGLVGCCAGMVLFLMLAGSSVIAAVVSVGLLLLVVMMVARIAAETGLYYVQINVPLYRAWTYLSAAGLKTSGGSFFWTSFLGAAFTHDTRETLSVYSTHALKVNDELAPPPNRRQGLFFIAALLLAGVAAYGVGGASMLSMEYAHASTLSSQPQTPVNAYGVEYVPRALVVQPTLDYARGADSEAHSRTLHLSTGAGITALLGVLRIRYAAWPLHPLAFLLVYTFPIGRMWFSILLGWIAKAAAVHYGGAALLRRLRDLALGLIVGEAAAVAFWLIVAVLRAAGGDPYHVMYLTP